MVDNNQTLKELTTPDVSGPAYAVYAYIGSLKITPSICCMCITALVTHLTN